MRLNNLLFYCRHPRLYKWRKFGFDLSAYQTLINKEFQKIGISTIIDIGANTGQSVITFRLAFPHAAIYAIEPLPACFRQLQANVAGLGGVHLYNTAVGNQESSVTMEENGYTPSSSVLRMTNEHVDNFPFTKSRRLVEVNMDTLDNLLKGKDFEQSLLIKLDVQGYEKNVIAGGYDVINQAKVLIVETSFEILYNGQPLFDEVYAELTSLNFRYAGAFSQLRSPLTGKILQQDALFIRS